MTDSTILRFTRAVAAGATLVLAGGFLVACSDDDSGSSDGGDASGIQTPELVCDGPAASGEPVTIGFMWPEGGELIDQPQVGDAASATAEYVNDCLGGIGGRPIELDECPEGENEADITACANQFIENDVDAVSVSATGTPETIATPVVEAGIPFTSSNGVGSEQLDPNVFIWASGAIGALGGIAVYASENDIPSVAIVTGEELVGQVQPLTQPAFDAVEVELQFIGVPTNSPDFTPQIRTGLEDDPGLLVVIGNEPMCISYLQATEALAVDVPVGGIQTCTDESVIDAVGEEGLDGKVIFGARDTTSDDPEAELYRAVMAEYAPDVDPFGFATFGYASILSLVRAAEDITGDVNAETLTEAFGRDIDHPLPLGAGSTFNCGKDWFVEPVNLQAICSGTSLVGTVDGTTLADVQILDVAPLFGG